MNAKTLKALRGSIAKWQRIVAGDGVDEGAENCALCALFIDAECVGCPVSKNTGMDGCIGSPYVEFENAWIVEMETLTDKFPLFGEPRRVVGPQTMAAALREVDFLTSLLP